MFLFMTMVLFGSLAAAANESVNLEDENVVSLPAAKIVISLVFPEVGKEYAKVAGLDGMVGAMNDATKASKAEMRAGRYDSTVDLADPGVRDIPTIMANDYRKVEDIFNDTVAGDATWTLRLPEGAQLQLDCDYRLELWVSGEKLGVTQPEDIPDARIDKLTKWTGSAGVGQGWQLVRCTDDKPLQHGAMLWLGGSFKLKGGLTSALASDYAATSEARSAYAALAADIRSWRAAGSNAEPGATLAGISPATTGAYASPVRADGTRAHWEQLFVAADVSEGAIKGLAGKIPVKNGKLARKATNLGAEMVASAVSSTITEKLPADHYFDSACDLVAWLDAAYVHRSDYSAILSTAKQAYPEVGTDYRHCLMEKARERSEAGLEAP